MRYIAPELLQLMEEGKSKIAGMIRFDFPEGSFGFICRKASKVFGGVTYDGIPDGIFRTSDFVSQGGTAVSRFTITLGASKQFKFTPTVIKEIESYSYQGAQVTIYDQHHHPETHAEISDPFPMMVGTIDRVRHKRQGGRVAIIECANLGLNMSKRNDRYRTTSDQTRRAPGDLIFEHAASAATTKVNWGKT